MKKELSERELLLEVCKKLDVLIGLIAAQTSEKDKIIKILHSLGLSNNEIGKLSVMTGENVRLKLKKK